MKQFYVFIIIEEDGKKKYRLKNIEASTVREAIENAFPKDVLGKAKKIICAPIEFDFEKFKRDMQKEIENMDY